MMGVVDTTTGPLRPEIAAIEAEVAARLVAHSVSPRDLEALAVIQTKTPMFFSSQYETAEQHVSKVIAEALLWADSRPEGHDEWWAATGESLTAALMEVTGARETEASFLVAASAAARILAGHDRGPDSVLRLAERAACYQRGYLAGSTGRQ